jgi:S1-C subfamily serine protease
MNIMLRISSVWFCVFVLAARAMPSADPAALYKEVRPAIAIVVAYDGNKNILSKGTGFFINEQGNLITNYDLLKGAQSAEVIAYDGNDYPIKLVLAESAESGLVEVSVDIPQDAVKVLPSAASAPKVTQLTSPQRLSKPSAAALLLPFEIYRQRKTCVIYPHRFPQAQSAGLCLTYEAG